MMLDLVDLVDLVGKPLPTSETFKQTTHRKPKNYPGPPWDV